MIFDTHTDILYNIVKHRLEGKRGVVEDYHIPELLEGNVTGGIWTYYTDIEHLLHDDFDQAIQYIIEELQESENVQVVMTKSDWADHKVNVILGLEGLGSIRDIDHVVELYNKGFRHAMLTWNEQNQFATGVGCQAELGLTLLGCELVKKMNELGMVIDVSHANLHTFEDILSVTTSPVIASHSNCYALEPHPRNLTDEQIKEIALVDGVIGVTAVSQFTNPLKPDVESLVDHIDYLRNLVGVRHIALGFDFMNYLNQDYDNLIDCQSAASASLIIDELIKRGYSSMEIDGITHVNAKRVINHILKDDEKPLD